MRLGADPEVFLLDKNGRHISAIPFIQADKWNPMQIKGMRDGFTLQQDNVALEYGIPPAASADEFVTYIQEVMKASLAYVPGLSFSKMSCTVFPRDQMKHPLANVFGCEPDFNAWTGGKENIKPAPPHPFMRSAGGHIHVETDQDPNLVSKKMDFFLGIPATIMDSLGAERRQLYGKMGANRPKPYGVEYRVLSNFWIFEEKYIRWVWNQTQRALDSNINMDENELPFYLELAINNGDKKMAEALISEYNLEVA